MELFVFSDATEQRFWLTARLDNLGKGASGAAVQNMNIALGLDDHFRAQLTSRGRSGQAVVRMAIVSLF
jgi:N-acetyl-gamma-glutamylphosphate reductase